MSHELMILLAKNMPEENILEVLESELKEYRLTKNPEIKRKIATSAMLILTKFGTEGRSDMDVIKDFREKESAIKVMSNKQN